MNNFIN